MYEPIMIDSLAGFGALVSRSFLQIADGVPLQFTGDFLYLAVVFVVLALVAGLFGARGIAGISMEIARILIIVFVILAVIALLL